MSDSHQIGSEVMDRIKKPEDFDCICKLKERIFDFIDGRELTSFFNLEDHFGDEFSGDEDLYVPDSENLIFWNQMNETFINLLIEIVLEGHVREISGDLANVMYWDVRTPDLPIGSHHPEKYTSKRWFPVVFESVGEEDDDSD